MFFYDPAGQLIGEYRDDASTTQPDDWLVWQETIWLGDIPVAVITKPAAISEIQLHYIHTDHLNTPRAIVDTSNIIVWRWENTHAFGVKYRPPLLHPVFCTDGSVDKFPRNGYNLLNN